jgi:hypothetical protein
VAKPLRWSLRAGQGGMVWGKRHGRCQHRTKMEIKFFMNDISLTKSLDKLGCGKECCQGFSRWGLNDPGHPWGTKSKY